MIEILLGYIFYSAIEDINKKAKKNQKSKKRGK